MNDSFIMESLMNKSWWLSPLNIEKYNGIKVHNEHTHDNHNSSDMLLSQLKWYQVRNSKSIWRYKILIDVIHYHCIEHYDRNYNTPITCKYYREKESDMIHSLVQAAPSIISANGPVDPDFIALISLSYSFILPTPTPAPFPLPYNNTIWQSDSHSIQDTLVPCLW